MSIHWQRHLKLFAACVLVLGLAGTASAANDGNDGNNGNHYGNDGNNGNHYGNDGNNGNHYGNDGNNGIHGNDVNPGGGDGIAHAPELNPATGTAAFALLSGGILVLRARRGRARASRNS